VLRDGAACRCAVHQGCPSALSRSAWQAPNLNACLPVVESDACHDDNGLFKRDRDGVKEQSPFRHFVDAVHALSERPDAENVARYLAASREVDESRTRATHGRRVDLDTPRAGGRAPRSALAP